MRLSLCLLLLALAPQAQAQRSDAERTRGYDPDTVETELRIEYAQDAPRGQAAPATITLHSASPRVESARRVGIQFNGERGSLVALSRDERSRAFVARDGVPAPRELRSITIHLDDEQVLFPIPALREDEDGNQVGSYSEEGSGSWMVIKIGTRNPPPFIVIVIGDAPDDVVTGDGDGDSGDKEDAGEEESSDEGEGSGEGSGEGGS